MQYARTVRGSTLVESSKEYVQAARVIGVSPAGDHARRTCCPTCSGPVLVIATINIAPAIITEATLSFLGVGVPPTEPSLGTLIRDRQRFPVLRRMVDHDVPRRSRWSLMVLSVNLLGDWLRDALNPKLR